MYRRFSQSPFQKSASNINALESILSKKLLFSTMMNGFSCTTIILNYGDNLIRIEIILTKLLFWEYSIEQDIFPGNALTSLTIAITDPYITVVT